MIDCGSRRCERVNVVIIHIGRVLDRIEHDASPGKEVVHEVSMEREAKRLRVDLMDPVDHDDRIVDAGQPRLGKLEGFEARPPRASGQPNARLPR